MRILWSIIAILAAAMPQHAEITDSVVAVVDTHPIKHSDVIREIRLTAFMNREKADFGAAVKKEAVNRLIDQVFIRQEINAAAMPSNHDEDSDQAAELLRQLRESYGDQARFRESLTAYGLTEEELRRQLKWQVDVLQFVELRFGQAEATGAAAIDAVNEDFFAWLDSMREQKRVEIREERLK